MVTTVDFMYDYSTVNNSGLIMLSIVNLGAGSDAVKIGSTFFLRIACFYPVYGLATAFRSYLEGKGDLLYSSMAGVAALVIRIISSYAMTSFIYGL